VPWADLESTLNLGVGMVAIVARDAVDGVLAHASGLGYPAWVLGGVRPVSVDDEAAGLVSGTKGVHGGAVHLVGAYREA